METQELHSIIKEWAKSTNELMITTAVQGQQIRHMKDSIDRIETAVGEIKTGR